jgi:hypothetical protein
MRAFASFILGAVLGGVCSAQTPPGVYRVENIRTPAGIAPEVTAVAFGADGKLYASFRRGYIYALDVATGKWQRFASGLQTPMGILPGKRGEFFVVQLPELTRIVDENGDGIADTYETVSDAWGMSGNYHEFLYGPVRDAAGNFYITLGLASDGGRPRPPVRGEMTARGRAAKEPRDGFVNKVGHYSPVPFRGCALKISPDGQASVLSCGFRQPNGIVLSPEGDLFATDNQGDWVGTSPLHHLTPGSFHGHPASLNWDPSFQGQDPVETPVEVLQRRRKMPAIQFPQNDMAGSLTQPLFDLTGGKFGPYSGQLLVGEWTYPRLLRADLEKVGGEWQGACFILIEGNGLQKATNRMAFTPDGTSLYVAQTSRIWGSVEGLQKITWMGKVPMDVLHMRVTRTGFDLTFTKPVDPATAGSPAAYSFTHYYYRYHSQYGSPKTDITPAKVTAVSVSEDRRRVSLTLEKLVPGRVYELRPGSVQAADGERLATRLAAYTLNRLKN